MATRPSGGGGRASEARIGVEAAPCPQTDEDLARPSLKPLLHFNGIVARVEDEQGSGIFLLGRPAEKRFYLLGGDLISALLRADAPHVHGGGPALAYEVEPCDELVGPSGDDRLAGRVTRRMVVETALGAALRVAAGPHAYVYRVDGRSASGKRMAGEQSSKGFGVDPPSAQRGVEAAPAATVRGFEAQVNGRRDGIRRGEDGVGEFEEGVGPAIEAAVERVA